MVSESVVAAQSVWLFDDEPAYRALCAQAFEENNLTLRLFSTEDELRSAAEKSPLPVLIILDVLAPGGNATGQLRGRTGTRIYRDLKTVAGKTQFLFLTNLTASSVEKDAGNNPPKVLEKHFYDPGYVAKYVRHEFFQPSWMDDVLAHLESFADSLPDEPPGAKPVDLNVWLDAKQLITRVSLPNTPMPHLRATDRAGIEIVWESDSSPYFTLVLELSRPKEVTFCILGESTQPVMKTLAPDAKELDDVVQRLARVD